MVGHCRTRKPLLLLLLLLLLKVVDIRVLHAIETDSAVGAQATGQLNVLVHDSNAFSVDGAEIRVFEETDKDGFGSLLQGHDGVGLPALGGVGAADVHANFLDLDAGTLACWVCWAWELGDLTSLAKGSLRMSRSVVFWYFRIWRSATTPGLCRLFRGVIGGGPGLPTAQSCR